MARVCTSIRSKGNVKWAFLLAQSAATLSGDASQSAEVALNEEAPGDAGSVEPVVAEAEEESLTPEQIAQMTARREKLSDCITVIQDFSDIMQRKNEEDGWDGAARELNELVGRPAKHAYELEMSELTEALKGIPEDIEVGSEEDASVPEAFATAVRVGLAEAATESCRTAIEDLARIAPHDLKAGTIAATRAGIASEHLKEVSEVRNSLEKVLARIAREKADIQAELKKKAPEAYVEETYSDDDDYSSGDWGQWKSTSAEASTEASSDGPSGAGESLVESVGEAC